MFHRLHLCIFTFITFVISITINYLFPFAGLWMLFLLPMFGIILLQPYWLTGNLCLFVMVITRYLTQYAAFSRKIPDDFLGRLVTTSIAAWTILISVTFFILKMNSLFEQLQSLSFIDNLTGSFNRRYLTVHSEKWFSASQRESRPLVVLLFDIDHFKQINDTYGHAAGDLVLKELTLRIQKFIRSSDILARIGGEEFLLVLPNTELRTGLEMAESIRKLVEQFQLENKGRFIPVTISIGLLKYAGESLEEVLEQADEALYKAKNQGRNQTCLAKQL